MMKRKKNKKRSTVAKNNKIVKIVINLVVKQDEELSVLAKAIRDSISNPNIVDFALVSYEQYPVTDPLNTTPSENSILC